MAADESKLPAETLEQVRKTSRRYRKSAAKPTQEPQYSGPGVSERDPALISQSLESLIDERGWQKSVAVGSVTGMWPQLVGADIAQHVKPVGFHDESGTLKVEADSATWATQITLFVPQILQRLDDEVGPGIVRQITVVCAAGLRKRK